MYLWWDLRLCGMEALGGQTTGDDASLPATNGSAPVVLFVTSPKADLMQDMLHEGLDALLGPERVWCLPYKDYSRFGYYLTPPSAEMHPHRSPVGRARLDARRDDVAAVIVGSLQPEAIETWHNLQELFPGRPVALVNGQGSKAPTWPAGTVYTHRFTIDLRPEDQEPGLFALTYSVPPRVMLSAEVGRDIPVSFVARTTAPIRSKVAELLTGAGHLCLMDADLPREQYLWLLNRSRIAVSVRGSAWDTLRYWEIPCHGALLLSQRLPILIPDDFVEGESAVFFETLEDLLPRIDELLADGDRLDRIASAGRARALERHIAPARARYVLHSMGVLATLAG